MTYAVWIPIAVLVYSFIAWVSYKSNSTQSSMWFYIQWSTAFIPLWASVAKYSKDIVFDGVLFDVIMITAYTAAIVFFTKDYNKLGVSNYLGLLLMFVGLWFFKK